MPSKLRFPPLHAGPWCCCCGKPITGPALEVGLKDQCISCFLRPIVLVRIQARAMAAKKEASA